MFCFSLLFLCALCVLCGDNLLILCFLSAFICVKSFFDFTGLQPLLLPVCGSRFNTVLAVLDKPKKRQGGVLKKHSPCAFLQYSPLDKVIE